MSLFCQNTPELHSSATSECPFEGGPADVQDQILLHMYRTTGVINLDTHTPASVSCNMSIMRLLKTKRKADGGDMIIFAIIVVAVLAFFGFITLNFHI